MTSCASASTQDIKGSREHCAVFARGAAPPLFSRAAPVGPGPGTLSMLSQQWKARRTGTGPLCAAVQTASHALAFARLPWADGLTSQHALPAGLRPAPQPNASRYSNA